MNRSSDPKAANAAGAILRRHLGEGSVTQSSLATATGVSQAYVNFLVTGRRNMSPGWVDLISDTMKLSDEQRVEMHRAAAKDHGFEIDLT